MPVPLSPGPVAGARTLLKDLVYDRILAAIKDGTLQPGERLNDAALEEWLGVSRTPIRQALGRLSELGLVVIRANASTHVAGPDPNRIGDALETAVTLWQSGVHLVMPTADDATIEAVVLLYDVAIEAGERAAVGSTGTRPATEAMHDAARSFVVRANRPTLAATLRKAEIELAFQIGQFGAAVNWQHALTTLRAARETVARRDVPGLVAVLEAFTREVDADLAEQATPLRES